jgi:hypothetical protein
MYQALTGQSAFKNELYRIQLKLEIIEPLENCAIGYLFESEIPSGV